MRKRRKLFPTIKLDKHISYACYDWITNEILLGWGMADITDDAAIYVLVHEIEHFAQNMYLDKGETDLSIDGFNKNFLSPFVEYIAAHPGYYPFNFWEGKYNRGVVPVDLKKIETFI